MSSTNLQDVLGLEIKERQLGFLLNEILKLVNNKHDKFIDDIETSIKFIGQLYRITPYLDIQKHGLDRTLQYLNDLAKAIRIASDETIPTGFVGNLTQAKLNFEHTLIQVTALYKRSDFKILHDLGIKLEQSTKLLESGSEEEEKVY